MMTRKEAKAYRAAITRAARTLDDETATAVVVLFPAWVSGAHYNTGERVRYNDTLYSVIQEHTSQADWTPDVAVSLFARVLIPDPDVIPDWVQPDATNAYKKGDRVRFEGKVYESLIDGNVWSPTAYPAGWKAVTEE